MTATASATITASQSNATTYQYSVTLNDVSPGPANSTNTIGTFWFAWVPGQDYLPTAPISVASPSGWTFQLTGGTPNDGFGVRWVATSVAAEIQAGGSLSGFSFTSADTPAILFGQSSLFPGTPILTSVVYSGAPFSDAGTVFVVACFLAGTRIRTPDGEVPVETLAVGDMVETLSEKGVSRVKWVGHRHLDCRRHAKPRDVWPIRIDKDAFAPGMPARTLFLSPDHAIYAAGVLIPVRHLVNGMTIVQVPMDHVTYHHIELTRHAVVFANALPAESYLDTGNRDAFANGEAPVRLHPDFASYAREGEACAELVISGPRLAMAKAELDARAVSALACEESVPTPRQWKMP